MSEKEKNQREFAQCLTAMKFTSAFLICDSLGGGCASENLFGSRILGLVFGAVGLAFVVAMALHTSSDEDGDNE